VEALAARDHRQAAEDLPSFALSHRYGRLHIELEKGKYQLDEIA